MDVIAVWEQAQPLLQSSIGFSSYETWFTALRARQKDLSTLVIETPDEFYKNWIAEHYLTTIENTLKTLSSTPLFVELDINPQRPADIQKSESPSLPEEAGGEAAATKGPARLNPRFSFSNFVVGPSNRFSYAACMAVAESPGKAYNPLFIYGQVGLGKTHLLQSIALQIQQHHPGIKYHYTTSESFTNELIESIRHRSTTQFRQKYRNIDVLIIDDIQFIAGKESTQEEFFHTFNALHNSRKQIIISSDRPPKDINNLEERLVSRFAWGLITDVQPPDYETRVAILRKKNEQEHVAVPENVIYFIAEQIKTNIRELEGALIRVAAYSMLDENPISLDLAKNVLKDMVKDNSRSVTIDRIQKTVSEFFHISCQDLKGKSRSRNILFPRQIAMYLARQMTGMSLPEIGQAFGGKDHTTVMHSCKKIETVVDKDAGVKNQLDQIAMTLHQGS